MHKFSVSIKGKIQNYNKKIYGKEFPDKSITHRAYILGSQCLGITKIKTDKQVAKLLGLSSQSLANYKSKKVIPYKSIVNYCIKNRIAIDWVLMEDVWPET